MDSYPSITSTDIDNIPYEILESIFHDAKQTVLHFSLSKENRNLINSKCKGLHAHPCLHVKLIVIATIVIGFLSIQSSIYCNIFLNYIKQFKAKKMGEQDGANAPLVKS